MLERPRASGGSDRRLAVPPRARPPREGPHGGGPTSRMDDTLATQRPANNS